MILQLSLGDFLSLTKPDLRKLVPHWAHLSDLNSAETGLPSEHFLLCAQLAPCAFPPSRPRAGPTCVRVTLPCPCNCSHLPEKLPWVQTPCRRWGGPPQHPGQDQSREREGRTCSHTPVCFCFKEAASSLASQDALILLAILVPVQMPRKYSFVPLSSATIM